MIRHRPSSAALLSLAATMPAAAQVHLGCKMAVDNQFTASLSTDDGVAGAPFLSGSSWPVTYSAGLAFPAPGRYYLHVRAVDLGPPAMFIGRFELNSPLATFANGTQTLLTGPAHWNVSATGFGAGYSPPRDLGANGTGPWGTFPLLGAGRFIWHTSGAPTAYFSTPIDVTTCHADCEHATGVGVIDIFDFLCFQNRFAALDPYACDFDTLTGAGVCDIFDFLAFQNAFASGCP